MALWLYGFMALWLYGFMALWQRHPGALAILARQVDNAPMHHDNYRKCRDRNRSDSNLRAEALSAGSLSVNAGMGDKKKNAGQSSIIKSLDGIAAGQCVDRGT